jgi:predicted Rossmann fold flavoprotein
MSSPFDAIVVGAGAAGLFCAGVAAQRGLRVALIDHVPRLAEKIRISGGGRCNFTNLDADRPDRFLSQDPVFARTALRGYGPRRFVALVDAHRIGWHEKHRGQLFCDDSSERIIEMLRGECDRGGVVWMRPCAVRDVRRPSAPQAASVRFELDTDAGTLQTRSLVVATGGLSVPKIGATGWGLDLARRFGLSVVAPRPALVPLTFTAPQWARYAALAGLGLEVGIRLPDAPDAPRFVEDLLFTHRGLSGPAVLQISSFWTEGASLSIDLAPGGRLGEALREAREGSRQQLGTALAAVVPRRLASAWLEQAADGTGERRLAEFGNRALEALAQRFHDWRVLPCGTEGWRKAEVTAGGVSTEALDPRTLQVHAVPGLHFIGEVVDVTGWLGGYNFQWAWASGWAAAQSLPLAR